MNLDNRSRDKDGEIRKKRSDAKVKSMKKDYPELDRFSDQTRLKSLENRYKAQDLDQVLKAVRKENQARKSS